MSWSLTRRLTRRVLLAVGLGWLASLGFGFVIITNETNELLDDTLSAQAGMLLALAEAGAPIPPQPEELSMRIVRPGAPVSEAPWPVLELDGKTDLDDWHVVRRSGASGVVVELGQSVSWRRHELLEGIRAFLVLMVLLLAALLVIVRRTAIDALRPARQFATRLGGRDAADLSPIPAEGLPAELEPIPQALNGYLARIEALLDSERRFAADAAHELRTPIASAAAQAQLIAEGKADPETARRLSSAIDRLGHMVERLLQLSRAEADIRRQDSRADLVAVIRLLLEERSARRVLFDDADRESVILRIDPDMLAILLSNLIGNALDHGTGTPAIRLRPGPVIEVSNPVAAGAVFHLDRFGKGSASDGTGLGLAIARAIAAQNGLPMDFAMVEGKALVTVDFSTVAEV